MALGMWDDVIAANEEAMRVVNAQQTDHSPPPGCGHYNEWLQYAYYQAGRHRDGQRQLAGCAREGGAMVAWALTKPRAPDKTADTLLEYMQSQHLSLMTMRATSVVESPVDRRYDGGMHVDTADLGRAAGWDAFARGYAALQAADLAGAHDALGSLKAARHAPESKLDRELPDEDAYLGILADMLEGAIAAREGHAEQGVAQVRAAAVRYEALPFAFGPPMVVKPPRELAGEMLLALQRPKEALAEFDSALRLAPRRALSMLGRLHALQAMGDQSRAMQARTALAAVWYGADADLPLLAEVHASTVPSTAP
jgi:tetratricopeptide (TPR) repeat protein